MSSVPLPDSAPVRRIPSKYPFPGMLRVLPLVLILAYLTTLFVLFLVWPINWPIYRSSDWFKLIAYVVACYVLFAAGYTFATGPADRVAESFKHVEWIIIAGSVIGFVLLFPISRVYTGRWPWEVMSVISAQGEAYRNLQETLEQTTGQRGVIAFIRAIFAPLTFAVLPLGFLHWGRLSWVLRGFVGLSILTTVLISLLRGTDREFADLIVVGTCALLIALGRSRTENTRWLLALLRKYWILLVAGIFFLTIAASLFSDRKTERLGGIENRVAACVNDSTICADIEAPLIRWMPLQARFATSLFILSSASGFYGLELAMEKDFKPTWGWGHSPASLAIYQLVTGDEDLRRRTYTYRNAFDGWPEENYWSTFMTWTANDVGFPGTLLVLLGLGFVFGRAWRGATIGNSDTAAVVFCCLMITVFYLTANNQLLGGYDGYAILGTWCVLWLRDKRHQVVSLVRG